MRYLKVLVLLLLASTSLAQTTAEIDNVFSEWQNPDEPGYAAVVLHKGKVVYQKEMGLANVAAKTPITADTKFQMAGMSKHFTAFALLLLESEGKLSMEDRINQYIPDMPVATAGIKVKHLFSLSSGLHDYWDVKTLAGWHGADVLTHEQAMALTKAQKQLPFAPGQDYAYTNTEITLMAEIIEKVSGFSLAEFTSHRMFTPLGMTNTLFKDELNENMTGLALPYMMNEGEIRPVTSAYANAGPTNLYSTTNDLVKWEMNLRATSPTVGSRALINRLNSAALLDNGNTIDPLFGRLTVGQQLLHRERGVWNIYQTGSLGGYASSMFKFPEQDFLIIVLTNNGIGYNGYMGMQTCYLFLEDEFSAPARTDFAALKNYKHRKKDINKMVGDYWYDVGGYSRFIEYENDTMWYSRGPGNRSPLIPVEKNRFVMVHQGDEEISIEFSEDGDSQNMYFTMGDSAPLHHSKYASKAYTAKELEQFTGTFYNKDLNTLYEFELNKGTLQARHLKNGLIQFQPVMKDLFSANRFYFGSITYTRDATGAITGFTVNNETIRGLPFEKVG